jgi:hypothetical protein
MNQLRPFGLTQGGAEMEKRLQHLVGLEIGSSTAEMHIPAGGEAPFVIEDDADTPAPAWDRFVAVAARACPLRDFSAPSIRGMRG